jgi:mannose/fructose/N-acetylgalactosamine-specific phosphotransferase system component IIC
VNTPFFFEEIVLLSLLGGILAVDDRVGWQSLLSQPLFAGIVVGLLLGEVGTALKVGLVLELVWLSVMPMRATRRPDAVTGAVVGAGAACLLIKHTGDPRFLWIASVGVVMGLTAGEISGLVGRRVNKIRERVLGGFSLASSPNESRLAGKLAIYMAYSAGFYFVVQAVLVLILVPSATLLAERFTSLVREPVLWGASRWLELLPAIGAASVIQLYWQKQINRYLVLCAGIIMVLLWIN